MAKKETNVSQWVDERLASLDADAEWPLDIARGQAKFQGRRRAAMRHRVEWIMAAAASIAACAALMIFSSPGACARPNGCTSDQPRPAAPVAAVKPEAVANFKESGSPSAPIVCEIYTDYECPHCAAFYRDTVPLLMEQYVRTGKVRLVHRDFPLQRNPYSRLAARYANAAGAIGQYELVMKQIFQTQAIWARDGNVDGQVMQVLAPGAMQKVREIVAHDPHVDDSLTADMQMAAGDRVDRTPFMVIVAGGRRQSLGAPPQFPILRTYLDQLLAGQ